jgi:ubiquinone/menaquinone biosynthesis C-methylase UbiE
MDEAEFDRFAEHYCADHAASIRLSGDEPPYFHRYKVEVVRRECDRLHFRPRRILDFGGGVGNSIPFFKAQFGNASLFLIDPSERSLEIALQRHGAATTFIQCDGALTPFAEGEMDLVFVACVFHHVPQDRHAPLLAEINRILLPSGHLFLFEHNPLNPLTRKAVNDCPFDKNAVLIRASRMAQKISDAGFSSTRVQFTVFFPHMLRALRWAEPMLGHLPIGGQYYVHAIKRADQ